MGGAAIDSERGALLQMLQDKDRTIAEMSAQLAEQPSGEGANPRAAWSEPELGEGRAEGGQVLELRRHLKDRTAQLTLLTQRYDHLNSRFETVRDNHEKVLGQMSDLNRVIRDERSENAKLRQELQQAQVAQDELSEKGFQLEQLRAEKTTLEDENRRILAKARGRGAEPSGRWGRR